jgi:hypothetical protein
MSHLNDGLVKQLNGVQKVDKSIPSLSLDSVPIVQQFLAPSMNDCFKSTRDRADLSRAKLLATLNSGYALNLFVRKRSTNNNLDFHQRIYFQFRRRAANEHPTRHRLSLLQLWPYGPVPNLAMPGLAAPDHTVPSRALPYRDACHLPPYAVSPKA